MTRRVLALRAAGLFSLASLSGCADTAEGAAEGLFEWMMLMVIIAILGFVVWALVLAGGIAALVAGWRRLNRDRTPGPPTTYVGSPPPAGPPPALPNLGRPEAGSEQLHDSDRVPQLPTQRPERRTGADPVAILLIVFGGLLVMGAGPVVLFNGNGIGNGSGGWFNVSVPLPMVLVAGALVWFGISRSRRS